MMVRSRCSNEKKEEKEINENEGTVFKTKLKWPNIIAIFVLHFITGYGLVTFPYTEKFTTLIFCKYSSKYISALNASEQMFLIGNAKI